MREAREIPEYNGKYLLTSDGKLFRFDQQAEEWVRVSESGSPPRVRLYANGTQYRAYVHKLLKDVFWDRPDVFENYPPPPSPGGSPSTPTASDEADDVSSSQG